MSEQPTEAGGDWRRQRRRGRPSRQSEPETPETEAEATEEAVEEEQRSRTLFSFLEPSLNTIGAFGTPLVLAGIVAIVAGAVLVAFVSSMRLYGYISLGFGVALLLLVGLISLSSVVAAFHQPHRALRRQLADNAGGLSWVSSLSPTPFPLAPTPVWTLRPPTSTAWPTAPSNC